MRRAKILKAYLLAVLTVAVVAVPIVGGEASLPTAESVTQWLERFGGLAPFAYMAEMALVVATLLPSVPLNFVAGVHFGPVLGTVSSVAGATAGATISFLITRFLGRDLAARLLKGHILFCRDCSDRRLSMLVCLERLIPLLSFDMISYGAGLTKMSVRSFVASNVLGRVPLTFTCRYFGPAVAIGRAWSIALSAVCVALFFLLPW